MMLVASGVALLSLAAWTQPPVLRTSSRRHATPRLAASPVAQSAANWNDLTEDASRLTDVQIARTIAVVANDGVLCTQLQSLDGATFASPAPFVVDDDGCPLVMQPSAQAASNLDESEAKTVTFYAKAPRQGAAGLSVLTLIGTLDPVPVDMITDEQLNIVSDAAGVSAEAAASRAWVRVSPTQVHVYDAVRTNEAWVAATDYSEAEPNPLAASVGTLLAKINTQHRAALKRFAAVYSGVPADELVDAQVVSIDQMGFDMRVQLGPSAPESTVRAGFKQPPANEEEGTSVFMKLFQEAYEKQNGFM